MDKQSPRIKRKGGAVKECVMLRMITFAIAVNLAISTDALASTIFDVSGTDISLQSLATNDGFNFYSVYGPGTFSGSMTIDTATFTVTEAQIHVSVGAFLGGDLPFSLINPQTGPDIDLSAGGPTLYLHIDLTNDTVTGFANWTTNCGPPHDGLCTTFAYDIVGALTPLPPASMMMLTGLSALGLLGWRRKRKAQADC
jgi:hypothetical protein